MRGQLQKKAGGRFFKKNLSIILTILFLGKNGFWGFIQGLPLFFFSTIPQSLPVSCFLKRD